jgi:hypothetical protein
LKIKENTMTFYELQSWVNFILPLIAAIGYLLRIVLGLRHHDNHAYRIMLPLFFIASVGMSSIYLLNITSWWKIFDLNYERYSMLYVRPYFTFLGSVLVISAWTHPELTQTISDFRRGVWTMLHGLFFKKE